MLKSMIRKELRDLLPLATLALVVQLMLIAFEMGFEWTPMTLIFGRRSASNTPIPFSSPGSCAYNFIAAGISFLVFGVWQSAREVRNSSFLFLFHRPVTRQAIIGAKLLVGGIVCIVVIGLPLLLYALWAATPGMHASPFFWSMTVPSWVYCYAMLLIYLGGFLCGIRQARWYGSRVLPVLTAVAATIVLMGLWQLGSGGWAWLTIPLMAVCGYAFIRAIMHVTSTSNFS